ncbi:MAG: TonB family protein, partial [Polyangiaceae bacterium]
MSHHAAPRRLRGWAGAATICALFTWGTTSRAQPTPDDPPADEDTQFDAKGRQIQPKPAPPSYQKIQRPEPKGYVAPEYPPAAKEAGLETDVILRLTIDETGKVTKAEVDVPSDHPGQGFESAAIAAGKKLTFEPARYADGRAFAAVIRYKYEFRLDDAPEPAAPETGVFSGEVLVQGLDTGLAGARVVVTLPSEETLEVLTDVNGKFTFADLEPGLYPVTIGADGYTDLALSEEVQAGGELVAKYRLSADLGEGDFEVYTQSKRPPREITRRTLEKREIDRIPGTNGDALRSLQSLPGV